MISFYCAVCVTMYESYCVPNQHKSMIHVGSTRKRPRSSPLYESGETSNIKENPKDQTLNLGEPQSGK